MTDLGTLFSNTFSREAGQNRRRNLNRAVNENLDYFLGPTGIPDRLRAVNAFFNPIVGLEDAGALTQQAFDPTLSTEERMRAAGGALLETAMAAAPAFGVAKAGQIASQAPTLGRTALDVGQETATRGLAETLALGAPDVPYSAPAPLALPAPPQRPLALPAPDDGLGTRIFRPDGELDVNATIWQTEENQRLLNGGLTNREVEAARLAQMREEGAPTAIDAPDVIAAPGPRYPMAPRDEDTGILFSQAYQSAIDLKQNKGTVGQLRKQLLNSGVKEEELEFRGFDLKFPDPDQKITKQDLIDFFDEADGDVVRSNLFLAEGKTGGEGAVGDDELVDRYVEMNLDSEADYYLSDYLPEQLQSEYQQVRDLTGEELEDLASANGYEDVDEFFEAHEDDWIVNDELYSAENEAIVAAYGDPYTLAEERLRENVGYEMTRDELREAVLGDAAEGFDPRDTTWSKYMLPGISDYFENVFETDLPSASGVDLSFRKPYPGGHSFDHGDVRDQNFWVRGGRVPYTETGPANVRALMEIQSDLSQRTTAPGIEDPKGRKPMRRTLAEDQEYAAALEQARAAEAARRQAREQISRAIGFPEGTSLPTRYSPERSIRGAFSSEMPDRDGLVSAGDTGQRQAGGNLADVLVQTALRQNFTLPEGVSRGDLPPTRPGNAWDPNPVTQRNTDLALGDSNTPDTRQFEIAIRRTPEGGREFVTPTMARETPNASGAMPDPATVDAVYTRQFSPVQGSASFFDPTDADLAGDSVNLGFATRGVPRFQDPAVVFDQMETSRFVNPERLAETMAPLEQVDPDQPLLPGFGYTPAQQDLADALTTLRTKSHPPAGFADLDAKETSAPFQQRDVGPVRAAVARQLADAVAEGDSALVTGTGEMAHEFTHLPASKFYVYDKETPKVLQKILDKAAPGTKVEPITVYLPEAPGADHRGRVQMLGVRLTPEVKRAIEYHGIPYFSLGGGLVALGAATGLPGEGEARRPDA